MYSWSVILSQRKYLTLHYFIHIRGNHRETLSTYCTFFIYTVQLETWNLIKRKIRKHKGRNVYYLKGTDFFDYIWNNAPHMFSLYSFFIMKLFRKSIHSQLYMDSIHVHRIIDNHLLSNWRLCESAHSHGPIFF